MNVLQRTNSSILFILTICLLGCASDLPTISPEVEEPAPIAGQFDLKIGNIGYIRTRPVFQGQHVLVPITLTTDKYIGGYDLLIGYDNAALSFQTAAPGIDLTDNGWEYFTYRYGSYGYNCDSSCPTGLLRLTSIAETNNGPNHPIKNRISELTVLDFMVTNDRTYECEILPIKFFWFDCGDNSIADWNTDTLYISNKVYNSTVDAIDHVLDTVLFKYDEIQNADTTYPTFFGAQYSSCDSNLSLPYDKNVSFYNGSVYLYCDNIVDARGDINLNSVSNELADAVLFSNYFLYGLSVFTIYTEGQIAASDVNADGLSLSVADLAYLMRIIYGDALPYPKIPPVQAELIQRNDTLKINEEMGAAFVEVEGQVSPTLLADSMSIGIAFDGTNTRVLVYSLEGHTFMGDFLATEGKVLSTEFGSAQGAVVTIVPTLGQNYPNPFSSLTTIPFYINIDNNVKIEIKTRYGITKFTHTAHYEAGNNTYEYNGSSQPVGEYNYTLTVDSVSISKTMTIER